MSVTVEVGNLNVQIKAERLTREAFAPFGEVIANPRPDLHPTAFASQGDAATGTLPFNGVSANQGSAIQYRNVSLPRNLYDQAPSGKGGQLIMSEFVCGARKLSPPQDSSSSSRGIFAVNILERHPFTTQTFSPLVSSPAEYLVIVAPSLSPGSRDEGLPVPELGDHLPGRGLPDVRGLKAFVASSRQAVTYGAGTWHAPMVALGDVGTSIDFLVVQFSSGVAVEDCQLAPLVGEGGCEPRIEVQVPAKMRLEKL